MFARSASVSGVLELRGGVGKVRVGRWMFSSAYRPGIEEMVEGVKDVQGRIWRISHQKCCVCVSRTWMLSCRTRAGAGLGEVT